MIENIINEVEIDDFGPDVLTEMLKFIYTAKGPDSENLLKELLIAADKYQIDALKKVCEIKIIGSIGTENCISLLILGEVLRAANVKKAAFEFVINNREQIKLDDELGAHPTLMLEVLKGVFGKGSSSPRSRNELVGGKTTPPPMLVMVPKFVSGRFIGFGQNMEEYGGMELED